MNVGVVGGGVSGLATAALLARAGHRVRLFDGAARLGGLAAALQVGPHRFCPGPQYLWGMAPGEAARVILDACGARLATRALPTPFEWLVTGEGDLAQARPAGLTTAVVSAGGRRFVEVLEALGRCGGVISEDAGFMRGGPRMVGAVLASRLGLSDKLTLLRYRDASVGDVARALAVPDAELRGIAASQPIFAEALADLSIVLFAACREVGRSVSGVVDGMPALVESLAAAATDAGVELRTGHAVVGARGTRDGVRLELKTANHQSVADVDHVVWACSPAVVDRVLGRRSRFLPSHPVCCVALDVDLDDDVIAALEDRSLTWCEGDGDVRFDDGATVPRTLNLLMPRTINQTTRQTTTTARRLVCAYGPSGSGTDAVVARATRLLRPRAIHGTLSLDGAGWEAFGDGGSAVYGRRKTAAAMQARVDAGLPSTMSIAHAGAGIPGVLGCLQMARACAMRLGGGREVDVDDHDGSAALQAVAP